MASIESSTGNLRLSSTSTEADVADVNVMKPYVCRYCDIRFSREKACISHEKVHKDQASNCMEYRCTSCDGDFVNQKSLNEHVCVKATDTHAPMLVPLKKKSKVRRKKHQRTMQPNDDVNGEANRSFASNQHTMKPSIYKIACPECDKMFQTKQKMNRHKWIHRKKAFSCEVCPMSFLLQVELDHHRLSEHAEQKKYMCTECGKSVYLLH